MDAVEPAHRGLAADRGQVAVMAMLERLRSFIPGDPRGDDLPDILARPLGGRVSDGEDLRPTGDGQIRADFLMEQGLERMIIAPVNLTVIHRDAGQALVCPKPGEAGAGDHDLRTCAGTLEFRIGLHGLPDPVGSQPPALDIQIPAVRTTPTTAMKLT